MTEHLTEEMIDQFLDHLRERGCSTGSLKNYQRALIQLYASLPEEKEIGADTVREWKETMVLECLSPATVNFRISVCNSFMKYLGHRKWKEKGFIKCTEKAPKELTRMEYLRLLSTAKALKKEKAYLLIKVMGGNGIRVQELSQLTVEAIRRGAVSLEFHNRKRKRETAILEPLRGELLAYAKKEGIREGAVFTSVKGKPMLRSSVYKCIDRVSREAKVRKEKATPLALFQMYMRTRMDIDNGLAELKDRNYQEILEQEQRIVGWQEIVMGEPTGSE